MEHVLVPVLSPGDIVVLDNPPAHKVPGSAKGHRTSGGTDDVPPFL